MFVCSCLAITDRTVEAAIASGARTIDDLIARCGAGAKCGGCHPELSRRLREHAYGGGQNTRLADRRSLAGPI